MDYLVDIDLGGNELQGHKVEGLAGDPASTYVGRLYYNTVSNRLREYNGTEWSNVANDLPVKGNTLTETGEAIYNLDGTTTTFTLGDATGSGRRVLVNRHTAPASIGGGDSTVGNEAVAVSTTSTYGSAAWVTIEQDISLGFSGTGWRLIDLYWNIVDNGGPGAPPTYDLRVLEYSNVIWTGTGYSIGDSDASPDVALTAGNTYTVQIQVHVSNGSHRARVNYGTAANVGLGTGGVNEAQLQFYMEQDTSTPPIVVTPAAGDTINGSSTLSLNDNVSVWLTDAATDKWTATPHKTKYTKTDVGLGSVDNTTDINKPISTAVNTELTTIDGRLDALEAAPDNADLNKSTTHVSSTTWTINHNLGKHPSVTLVNNTGQVVVGELSYTNSNQVVATFNTAVAGTAYCN